MRKLELYADYSRQEVHDIFDPDSEFTPQTGSWGIHGILRIPGRPSDYVFFVTFGQEQGGHVFDEGVTEDGLLTWQSQPGQTLDERRIRDFIAHDETANSIYLFLRTSEGRDYTYLGQLKYVVHDRDREQPVYFRWQILDWEIPDEVVEHMGLEFISLGPDSEAESVQPVSGLREEPPPQPAKRLGTSTPTFKTRSNAGDPQTAARRNVIGTVGEEIVVEHQRKILADSGQEELSGRVRHVAQQEGDGAGYDVLSFGLDGTEKYIEVKTTTGPSTTPFYMTRNEVEFSRAKPSQYFLYRLYSLDEATRRARFFMLHGDVTERLEMTPIEFRVEIRAEETEAHAD